MRPNEHYQAAQEYLDLVKDMLAEPQSADRGTALPALYTAMAQVHATLATATADKPVRNWGTVEVVE